MDGKRILLLIAVFLVVGLGVSIYVFNRQFVPNSWPDYDVLTSQPPRAPLPVFNGKTVSYNEYSDWVRWGEEWFRSETFGNERVWTDLVGLLHGMIDVPAGDGTWRKEPFFKYLIRSIDALDNVRGNLFSGNGDAYTSDLVVSFPPGCMLDETFPIPERLHTGLDVEAGSSWPLGIVPIPAPEADRELPYLIDPALYADGPEGVGPSEPRKYRIGLSCALCHYSLDVDWDGKADQKSARPGRSTPGSLYSPEHSWAISNQDIALGWIFAMSVNTIAGFETSGVVGTSKPADARRWAEWVRQNYSSKAAEVKREVDRGLLAFPRGFADDTPDGLHNPLQFPSLFTYGNWPFNYDGVMLNPSDRNNNVWTSGLDLTQFVALCNDRGGASAKLLFWEEPGMYSVLSAKDYAEIVVHHAPAVLYDQSQHDRLRDDILGVSDGMPGLLSNDGVVLISGVPGAIPDDFFRRKENVQGNRIREPRTFGLDGDRRLAMVGLLGTRVVTTPAIRKAFGVDALEQQYGLNGDEFVTQAVSMMLDWVQPPPNRSALLANARRAGLVEKGYQVFKREGCADCHAGPFGTNNTIIPLKEMRTDSARALATAPLQTFLAPRYDPQTGTATAGGIFGALSGLFAGDRVGYKVVTLRYLWGSAPYLHDGGVAVGLPPHGPPAGDDLASLLARRASDKVYGVAQILNGHHADPGYYPRANAALSLQALLLQSERARVVDANRESVYPIPGTSKRIAIEALHIRGVGHDYYVADRPGGKDITALVAFLLALDDDPRS